MAVEDRFGIVVTRDELARVYGDGGSSLRKLARMIEDLQEKSVKREDIRGLAPVPEDSGP